MGKYSAITYFDKNFLDRGLALVKSALANNTNLEIFYVQAMDAETFAAASNLFFENPRVKIVSPNNIETDMLELQKLSSGREIYFALKPIFIVKCVELYKIECPLLYLDADLFFFQELSLKLGDADEVAVLTEHLFAKRNSDHNKYGRFNAGLMLFRLDTSKGRDFIYLWLKSCLENVRYRDSRKTFSDQLILEQTLSNSTNYQVISDLRVNQSLWSIDSTMQFRTRATVKKLTKDCIVYHFHGFFDSNKYVKAGLRRYGRSSIGKLDLIINVYLPYICELFTIKVARGIEIRNKNQIRIILSLFIFDRMKW